MYNYTAESLQLVLFKEYIYQGTRIVPFKEYKSRNQDSSLQGIYIKEPG